MAALHLLGTGAAFTDAWRTTTMLAFAAPENIIAVDCGGDLYQRIQASQLNPAHVKALFITHEHPDHCGGFPLFMEKRWLAQLREPFHVYGPEAGLNQAKRIFDAFGMAGWKGMPEIVWHPVPMEEGAFVLEDDDWRIHAMPVSHPAPTLGLRVAYKPNGFNVTYSCDTSPDERVIRMAHHSDILVHEANLFEGSAPNVHSSIPEAASIAAQAEAERLILVHVPPGMTDAHLATARRHIFPNMDVGTELGVYPMAKG